MAVPPSRDLSMMMLLDAARDRDSDDAWLEELLVKELQTISATMPQLHSTSCFLHDLGNFLLRTTNMLSRLSERVVNGQDLLLYANGRIMDMEREQDFSELDPLDYLNEKHSSLKTVASTLQSTVQQLNAVWIDSRKPPFQGKKRKEDCLPSLSSSDTYNDGSSPAGSGSIEISWQDSQQSVSAERERELPQRRQSSVSSGPFETPNPGISDPVTPTEVVRNTVDVLLENLKLRGTGDHVCPYGLNCGKGGVDTGGLVVFKRNSAFRAHLLKHQKGYICTLPGCSAKSGFARSDQLRRRVRVCGRPSLWGRCHCNCMCSTAVGLARRQGEIMALCHTVRKYNVQG